MLTYTITDASLYASQTSEPEWMEAEYTEPTNYRAIQDQKEIISMLVLVTS